MYRCSENFISELSSGNVPTWPKVLHKGLTRHVNLIWQSIIWILKYYRDLNVGRFYYKTQNSRRVQLIVSITCI